MVRSPKVGATNARQPRSVRLSAAARSAPRWLPQGEVRGIAARVETFVLPSSTVFTDEWVGYNNPGQAFDAHHRINQAAKVYVHGNVHTNTIEGFWSLVKNGLSGTHHAVSEKHLQGYFNEFAWGYNHRDDTRPMF